MTRPPAFDALSDAQLRAAIRRTLEATSGTNLAASVTLADELRTLQGLGLVPATLSLEHLRELWADVERELEDEVHASRASRRGA